MFTRAEQAALRELIADKEALRARVAVLEDGAVNVVTSNLPLERFEKLQEQVSKLAESVEALRSTQGADVGGSAPSRERKRGRS